jgi:hypothetical protein
VRPVRIAFLTTEATASARVININSMAPWVEVAIVGEDTLDQPLGTATEGVTAAAGSDRYPLPLHPAPALRWPPGVG